MKKAVWSGIIAAAGVLALSTSVYAQQTANGTVTVDVADSGPGITPDARDRIFRPFWSTDGRGTGLGLPIASELAVALGGRIELQTEVGKGSRFRLVLPNRTF